MSNIIVGGVLLSANVVMGIVNGPTWWTVAAVAFASFLMGFGVKEMSK